MVCAHMLCGLQICKSDFKILLMYLGSMQGNQRQLTIDRAREVLDSYVEGSEGTQSQGGWSLVCGHGLHSCCIFFKG